MISCGILFAGDYLDGKVLINGAIILPLFVSILQDAILFITIWGVQEIYEDIYIYIYIRSCANFLLYSVS